MKYNSFLINFLLNKFSTKMRISVIILDRNENGLFVCALCRFGAKWAPCVEKCQWSLDIRRIVSFFDFMSFSEMDKLFSTTTPILKRNRQHESYLNNNTVSISLVS